ncbi:alpha-L-rhamnosidase-related protein [Tichowtungia aerotolerans]|uniref:alpha-L-rhamnosidase n=1 Tax=Tichowtungia aerotolerans TaxID=2697043 RepID=A0A6P1M9R7_9BACT|nr:alpha-L-rhamnosidase N-terminal domain-containing protein [Tichowtungia aerotolerans]QHI69813.1 hypothetical protein GT409_10245 [Tichowtungia aerotolerans]
MKRIITAGIVLLLLNSAPGDEWGDAQWITGCADIPRDAFVSSWEDSAFLNQLPNKQLSDEHRELFKERFAEASVPVVFRKRFHLDRPAVSAQLKICGLGYYQAELDDKKIGNHALAPNVTHYDTVARYQEFDLDLAAGEHEFRITVAPGRLNEALGSHHSIYRQTPVLKLCLDIGDGSPVISDPSWLVGSGPIRRAAFWVGEAYDATRPTGNWRSAEVAADFNPKLVSDSLPPQRAVRCLKPVAVNEPQPGVWVYDFGRMTVGKARVKLPANAEVSIRYSDLLAGDYPAKPLKAQTRVTFDKYPDGTDVDHPGMLRPKWRGSLGGRLRQKPAPGRGPWLMAWGFCDFVKSADEPLDYHASFDYTGFRYVEITGLSEPLPEGAVEALEIHNDLPMVGKLQVGNPKLQAVADAAALSILLNTQGTYQDNPGAERCGGNSNISYLSYPHAWYAFDNHGMASKAMEDASVAREASGAPVTVTLTRRNIEPYKTMVKKNGSAQKLGYLTTDGFHYGMTPLNLYSFYGDRESAERYLDLCAFYFECLLSDGLPRKRVAADHMDFTAAYDLSPKGSPRPTDVDFGSSAMALWQGKQFVKTAELLGRDDLAQKVEPLLVHLRAEIDRQFLNPATGLYAEENSASRMGINTLLICAEIVSEDQVQTLIDEMVEDIRKNNNHLTTGSRLTGPLLSLLARNGYIDVAIEQTTRDTYPSPYAMLSVTGGTIAEVWGFPEMPAAASLVQAEGLAASANWIYEALVGIEPTVEGPGFKRFRLAPVIPFSIPSCSFSFASPQGLIVSDWKQDGKQIAWNISIPVGAVAEIHFPFGEVHDWTVNRTPVSQVTGVTDVCDDYVCFASGHYEIEGCMAPAE